MNIKINKLSDFTNFFQKVKSQKLSFKTSYKLTLLNQEAQKHIDFYQESFRNLVLEYSKKDEQGNPISTEDGQGVLLAEETMQEAYQKLAELNNLDVELPDTKFSVDMIAIMPFIEG